MQRHDNLIGGEWRKGHAYSPNLNPSNIADTLGEYAQGDSDDVDAAVRDALSTFPHKLQDDQLAWGDLGWLGRIRFHQLGGAPLGEVADRMFDYVRTL